jgi:hypothetical protein
MSAHLPKACCSLSLPRPSAPAANAIEVIEDLKTITTGEAAQEALMGAVIARLDPGSV